MAALDLESHPPSGAIARGAVIVEPGPAGVRRSRSALAPGQISTLLARLGALMGEGRCGSPAEVASPKAGAFAMRPFDPRAVEAPAGRARSNAATAAHPAAGAPPIGALRRFRFPVPARVTVEHGRPVRVHTDRRGLAGGRVETAAPGGAAFARPPGGRPGGRDGCGDCDEWDVSLGDGAIYRVVRERLANAWFIEGVVD